MARGKDIRKELHRRQEIFWLIVDALLGMACALCSGEFTNILEIIIGGILGGVIIFYLPARAIQNARRGNEQNKLYQKREIAICNIKNILSNYFKSRDLDKIRSIINVTKEVKLPNSSTLVVDSENKHFLFYSPCPVNYFNPTMEMLEKDNITISELDNMTTIDDIPNFIKDLYRAPTISKIYDFKDLNRVEIIDKSRTDEKRTYTMESKSGDAFWGAVGGSILSETIFNEYATAGAIIGASGERKIAENVERKTHFEICVNIYLNDIHNSYKSFTFYTNESDVREFVGVLEYINNNR